MVNVEPPWKFMADIDIDSPMTLKRVMACMYQSLHPSAVFTRSRPYDWKFLSRPERKATKRMIAETKNSDLLFDMCVWFSGFYSNSDRETLFWAADELRHHATWFVRNPSLYKVEYEEARESWDKFRNGDGISDDSDLEMGGMREDDAKPERLVPFIDGSLADEDAMTEIEEPEEIKRETKPKKRKSRVVDIFKETILPGNFKTTRSGADFDTITQALILDTMRASANGNLGETRHKRYKPSKARNG